MSTSSELCIHAANIWIFERHFSDCVEGIRHRTQQQRTQGILRSLDPAPAVININLISTVLQVTAESIESRLAALKKGFTPVEFPKLKSLHDFAGAFDQLAALESLVAQEAQIGCGYLDDLEAKVAAESTARAQGGEMDSEASARAAAAAAKAKEAEANWTRNRGRRQRPRGRRRRRRKPLRRRQQRE